MLQSIGALKSAFAGSAPWWTRTGLPGNSRTPLGSVPAGSQDHPSKVVSRMREL